MSRFNRGARRVVDENGRFAKVSMEEYAALRSRAESVARSDLSSPARSPPARYDVETVPYGWRAGVTDDGSAHNGSEAEEDLTGKATEEDELTAGYVDNPTVRRLLSKSSTRLARFNELEQLASGGDLEKLEPRLFYSLSNEYHAMPQMLEALRKSNKPIDVICTSLEKEAVKKSKTGRRMAEMMDDFILKFCGNCDCTAYAAVMSLILVLGKWNNQESEGTAGFTLSRKVLKCWRVYAFSPEHDLGRWAVSCKIGELVPVREGNGTYQSFGYQRLNRYSQEWAQSVDCFLQGMTDYLSFVHIDEEKAKGVYDDFVIDVQAEVQSGVPHKNRQSDDQSWSDYIEGFEAKLEALDDAIKVTGDVKCSLNDAQVKDNLKEGLSKTQWLAINELMDQDSVNWDDLTLIEAYELGEKSMKNRLRKKVNRKDFRSFERKNKSVVPAPGSAGGSGGSGGGKGGKAPVAAANANASGGKGATATAPKKTVREKVENIPCRFFNAGTCLRGADCMFLHDEKLKNAEVVNMMICFDSGSDEEESAADLAAGELDVRKVDFSTVVEDEARFEVRCKRRFGEKVSVDLEERAAEEAEERAVKKELRREIEGLDDIARELKPACDKRQSVAPDAAGYALLGDYVDQTLIVDEETKAALLNSSIECDGSIDLGSEGSDAEVDVRVEKLVKVKYRQLLDSDARHLVQLSTTVCSNQDGDLFIQTCLVEEKQRS